ncbi:MAG: hypothetical protein AAF443_02870 [Chlamydiota bacterium]
MRKLLAILIFFLLLVLGYGYFVYYHAGYLLEKIIASKTNLSATVGELRFDPGQIAIENFQIANPKEAKLPTALKVETISVTAPYKNYLKNPIVIDNIHLEQIYINIQLYDRSQTRGNWQTLIAKMKENTKETSFFSIERETEIKRLLLTNIRIDLILANGQRRMLSPIRRLEFHNISSAEGIPIQKITQAIIQHMMQSIFLEKGLRSLFQAPESLLRGIFSPFFSSADLSTSD